MIHFFLYFWLIHRWLVSTQFSPIDARAAFPCFDRPDKKAQFEISLIHHENLTTVLSNMPSKLITYVFHIKKPLFLTQKQNKNPLIKFMIFFYRSPHPGYYREDFQMTPRMSTYLVAFMASNLVKTNASESAIKDAKLPQINIFTRKEVADMTQ